MSSHYTPLPLFLQIPVMEFPMEKTILVFSQLEGHKAQAPLLVPGAKFPADRQGVINWTAQTVQLLQGCHRLWQEGESAPKDSPGFQGPILHVESSKGSAILCPVSLHISGF